MGKKMRVAFFGAYLIVVIILTRLLCVVDGKIQNGVIIRDVNEVGGITETEKPE